MSAQPCGCDREAAWMCKRHFDERAMERALAGVRHDAAWRAAETEYAVAGSVNNAIERFKQRLADEDTMRGTVPIENTLATLVERLTAKCAELRTERAQIAAVLATFYRAELSMSSVQPLLTLALGLNPDLVERTR